MAHFTQSIEPCFPESFPPDLADLLTELPAAATQLGRALHPRTAESLADLVRVMNCYYSNLIEGHNTRPRDIERALVDELEREPARRDLQLEARAHIEVQRKIDRAHSDARLSEPTSPDFIRWLHKEFCQGASDSQLRVSGVGRTLTMVPGEWRSLPDHDVAVGRHLPPFSDRVAQFMEYFADRFRSTSLSPSQRIAAIATAHHRFNYIHPFPDGNGRVSRLMSHAMCLGAGVGAHSLWSVSRGLARGLTDRSEYKAMMDLADTPREGDLDGPGNLSLRRLNDFAIWFLKVCLDQVRFMSSQFELDRLQDRISQHGRRSGFRPEAVRILNELVLRGTLPRGDAPLLTRMSERTSRDVLKELQNAGLIASDTPKAPVYLRFSVESAEALFPKLFPSA